MESSPAQGVASLIQAQTDTKLKAARDRGDGHLADWVGEVLKSLAEVVALIEADIDFVEEPIEFIPSDQLRKRLTGID